MGTGTNNCNEDVNRLLALIPTDSAMPDIDSSLTQINGESGPAKRSALLGTFLEKTSLFYVAISLNNAPSLYAYSPRVVFPASVSNPVKGIGQVLDAATHGAK